jgi:hypothetical protein
MEHAWCRDVARDAAVRAAEDGRDRPLPTLKECIAGMFPKSGSASSPVDQENKGDGMRTERVTLEVVHGAIASINDQRWWDNRLWIEPQKGESVRVVSDEEREAALPDVSDQDGDRVAIDWQGLTKVLQAERDAANRERDAAVAESERRLRLCETMKRDGDSARFHAAVAQARVAELEEARKRFDTALEEARDASGINDFIVQRDEAFDERDAAIRERDELRKSWLRSEESGTRLLAQRNAALDAADGLRKRVAELEAASGGGEGEVDAWGVVRDGNVQSVTHRSFRKEADRVAEKWGGTVVPLYRAPPQPRGWLTGEERDLIAWIVDGDAYTEKAQSIAKGLLARSTPLEVVKPNEKHYHHITCSSRDADWIAALAAAGVAVKEVADA